GPELASLLDARGATARQAPAIELADPPDWQPLDRALDRLDSYDWVVFTSRNTLPRLLARMAARNVDPAGLARRRLAAIGEPTARDLRARGWMVAAVPESYRAEALAEAVIERLAREPGAGRRILLPRALEARDAL